MPPNLLRISLYTDVVLFFFSFFSKTSASSRAKRTRENERRARERKIKPVCRHLWEKRGLLSPSAMSTTHHYHLRVRSTNEIGDINCLCNCILQSNNSDTRSRVFVEACLVRPSKTASTPKKPAKRGPKPKQISARWMIVGYAGLCKQQ